jgi:hypothetical protein
MSGKQTVKYSAEALLAILVVAIPYIMGTHLTAPPPPVSVAPPVPPFGPDGQRLARELKIIDPNGAMFLRVAQGATPECARVTVAGDWHDAPYEERFHAARMLFAMWSSIRGSNAQLSLVDSGGREVGGRGSAGVWVQRD